MRHRSNAIQKAYTHNTTNIPHLIILNILLGLDRHAIHQLSILPAALGLLLLPGQPRGLVHHAFLLASRLGRRLAGGRRRFAFRGRSERRRILGGCCFFRWLGRVLSVVVRFIILVLVRRPTIILSSSSSSIARYIGRCIGTVRRRVKSRWKVSCIRMRMLVRLGSFPRGWRRVRVVWITIGRTACMILRNKVERYFH